MSEDSVVVAALYRFVALPDYRALREPLLAFCRAQGLRGTLLLAEEGINGTVAGSRQAVCRLLEKLRSDPRMAGIESSESVSEAQPFLRMKVKLKREIVTLGVDGVDPRERVGRYVEPEHWNALISDPEVLLIDTRNHYETNVGTFRGAVKPGTESFRDFPAWARDNLERGRHRRIAMFCTGGIRCEKATSFLLREGFEEVYHLRGGILAYLENVDPAASRWEGECFVFDERVTVTHALEPGSCEQCHACRHPLTPEDRSSPLFKRGASCPHCHGHRSREQRARTLERERQNALARARGQQHRGVNARKTAGSRSGP